MAFDRTKDSQEAEEKADKPAENEQEERDEDLEEEAESAEDSEESSDEDQDEPQEEKKPDKSDDPEVAALRKENARLRGKNKDEAEDIDSVKGPGITRAEKALYTSWQDEAKAEIKRKYPQLDDPTVYKAFVDEFTDRISILQLSKRKGKPVTKSLINERFESVARAIGLESDTSQAKEQGRAEATRTASQANIYRAGSVTQKGSGKPAQARQRVLPKAPKGGMKGWYKKPKTK